MGYGSGKGWSTGNKAAAVCSTFFVLDMRSKPWSSRSASMAALRRLLTTMSPEMTARMKRTRLLSLFSSNWATCS